MDIQIKRIYEAEAPDDGQRILVDRVWPRGISKERADLLIWEKVVAPSPELRKWFAHDPAKYPEFKDKYLAELKTDPEKQNAVKKIQDLAAKGRVTLLYGAKDEQDNQAVVLKEYLETLG